MIDINKRYRTRNGRPVRIYATDGGTLRPVHGAFWIKETKYWHLTQWSVTGRYDHNDDYNMLAIGRDWDLVEVECENEN